MRELHGAPGDYLRDLELRFRDLDLSGVRVLLDCAHGATYRVAPEIFRRLGADVDAVAAEPDGRNINDGVGSTHIDGLAEPGGRPAATTWASPSTATATACWRWTATAAWWTATSCWRWPPCTCAGPTACRAAAWPSP